MRKKLWTMTARQTAGAGLVVYMGPNLLPAIVGPSMIPYAMFWWIPLVLACWAGSFAWAVSHCRRALIGAGPSVRQDDRPRRLVDLLPRLSSRQDRRLVAHILERVAKIEALGRGEAAGAVVERAVLAADGLAALGQRRRFDASVPADREAALEELRREEKAGVVFRGELLRVASRLDDLCLLVARAKSAATPDEIARLGGEIEDLGRAVDAEQEVVALLGERR